MNLRWLIGGLVLAFVGWLLTPVAAMLYGGFLASVFLLTYALGGLVLIWRA